MHYLVIGVTGPSGKDFADAALTKGHQLTLYLRNPAKLDESLGSNPQVRVIIGTLTEKDKLRDALAGGIDAVIAFAGPVANSKGTPVTEGYRDGLFPAMKEAGVKRVLVLATPSHPDPADSVTWKWKASIVLIKLIGGSAYEEIRGIGALTVSQPLAELEWTLFRVPFLTNGAAGAVDANYLGHGADALALSRKSMAQWLLSELLEPKWIGKAPKLGNA